MVRFIRYLYVLLLCLISGGIAHAVQEGPFDRLLQTAEDVEADGMRRMQAIYALGKLGDARAVRPLLGILERDMVKRSGLWAAAIPALGMLGDPAACEALIAVLDKRDDDWLGREMAADALGRIGDASAVPALIRAAWLVDTREHVIAALARIGSPAGVPSLIEALDEGEPAEIRKMAMEGLRRIGLPAVGELIQAVTETFPEAPSTHKRVTICRLLHQIGGGQAGDALKRLATDADPQVSACAGGAESLDHGRPGHD